MYGKIYDGLSLFQKCFNLSYVLVMPLLPFYLWFKGESLFTSIIIMVVFSPLAVLLTPKWLISNVFTVSFFILFAIPVSISTILIMLVYVLKPTLITNIFFEYYYLFSIPIVSVCAFFITYLKGGSGVLNKLKVSLEYNNWMYAVVLFIFFFVSNSVNTLGDFHRLFPIISEETFKDKSIEDARKILSLFMQIASFPFLIANSILKSLVAHISYRKTLNN